MSNFSTRINRFFFRHRNKGIPNLMLYIVLGNAIVLLMSMMNGGSALYELLCFDKTRILQGEIWRLVTYVFTQSTGSFVQLLFLYFFYMLGRSVENRIGTLKFNLFYLSGVVLMDIFAMIFSPVIPSGPVTQAEYNYLAAVLPNYYSMAYFLHLSLVLAFATAHPDAQFLIFFLIPVKAWIMAVIYLVLVGIQVFNMCYPVLLFPHCLFPLVGLANYFLFFGSSLSNLLPVSWRPKKRKTQTGPRVIPFTKAEKIAPKATYTHKCTVCGRTDVDHPELEFRYCSRCNGYHCYCEDHISNHAHIE